MTNVTVPRWVVTAMGAALGLSLLALAFLLGRESRAPEATTTAAAQRNTEAGKPDRQRPLPAPVTPAESQSRDDVSPPPELPTALPVEAHAPTRAASETAPPAGAPPGPAAVGNAVCDYFAHLDRIPGARASGPSEEAAQRLVAAVLEGNSSGLNGLIADAESAERAVQALAEPPECSAHHQRLLALLGDSKALLTELRGALIAQDADRLTLMSGRALALRQRAEDLQAEEKELRRRCALAAD